MLAGYAGTILRIDLTQDKIDKQPLPAEMAESFIGGRGFVAKTLFDELPPGADPLGPENLFIAASGPSAATSCRPRGRPTSAANPRPPAATGTATWAATSARP